MAWPANRPYLHNLPPSKLASNDEKKKLETQED